MMFENFYVWASKEQFCLVFGLWASKEQFLVWFKFKKMGFEF